MAVEGDPISSAATVEAPRGSIGARVDEKGRLKLPSAVAQYIEGFGSKKVFITTLNGATARIYPISVWLETEHSLEQAGDDAEDRQDVAFIANHFGADDEMDAQGRVLMPTELRRALKMENETVFLQCSKQRIDVLSREVYQARLDKAMSGLAKKAQSLESKGLRLERLR